MKKRIFLFLTTIMATCLLFATNHTVNTQNMSFSPSNLIIDVGDSVTFNNTGGAHNVNGTIATFPQSC